MGRWREVSEASIRRRQAGTASALCALLAASLATGCGKSSSDQALATHGVSDDARSVESEMLGGIRVDTGADAGVDPPVAAPVRAPSCPAARTPAPDLTCSPSAVWARDTASGACCQYANECQAPAGWPVFQSEQDCETSCRCASFEFPDGLDPALEANLQYRIEHTSLECECPSGSCPDHVDQLATAGTELCGLPYPELAVIRQQGCGMIALQLLTGFGGTSAVFDAASGALIGRASNSDSNSGPCQTYTTIAGTDFRCDSAQTCLVCGQWLPSTPAPPSCD